MPTIAIVVLVIAALVVGALLTWLLVRSHWAVKLLVKRLLLKQIKDIGTGFLSHGGRQEMNITNNLKKIILEL